MRLLSCAIVMSIGIAIGIQIGLTQKEQTIEALQTENTLLLRAALGRSANISDPAEKARVREEIRRIIADSYVR